MAFLHGLRRLLIWVLVLTVGGSLALVYFLPRFPPQDLPWTPLDLDQPVGLATAGKIAALDGPACRALLDRAGIAYQTIPSRRGENCGFDDGVTWREGGRRRTAYRPAKPALACPLATALALWEREELQPAAEQRLGARVVRIDHYGSYACRRMYGRKSGAYSEHARARAIDIAGFELSDGRRVTVARDWNDEGDKGRFLHDARDGACRVFATTLSPDYNAAHHDHFHLDEAARGMAWRACR